MRVLVVAHGFPPAAQGGSEIYAHECARTLLRVFGDEILIVTRESDVSRAELSVRLEQRDGLSIAWINNTFRSVQSFARTYQNDDIDRLVADLVDVFKPQVAHLHHLTCLSTTIVQVLSRRSIPIFYTLHDYWLLCHRGQLLDVNDQSCDGPEPAGCGNCLGPAASAHPAGMAAAPLVRAVERSLPASVQALVRQSVRHAAALSSNPAAGDEASHDRYVHMQDVCGKIDYFFAPSQSIRDRFVRAGIDAERIALSPYGFDGNRFKGLRRAPSSRLRLGFLGSLMISKGPHVLLEAFRSLPAGAVSLDLFGAHCSYHGDSSYAARLQPLLAADGVRFHGSVPYEGIPDALSTVDVLVVPSIWVENSPLVIREAFLAGVPVVASRIGGIPEIVVDGENGLLFSPGDVPDLARTLKRLLTEPDLLGRLRSGIPAVRTIEDDVSAARSRYASAVASATTRGSRIAAVVLNYRTPRDTFLAVKSLLASSRALERILVVNNSPGDGCRELLDSVTGRIDYLETSENLGFSGGMNCGIRRALESGAEKVLLVNSDVIVPPDCVERLEDAVAGKDVGIAGPAVLTRTNPGSIASLGMTYVAGTGRMRHKGYGSFYHAHGSGPEAIDGVSGCLMLVRRSVFDAVGLLDEDYFFGFEDLDFCLRARRAGFITVVEPRARVYHEGGRSIGPASTRRLYFAARNHLLMASRHRSGTSVTSVVRSSSIVALNLAHAITSRGGSPAGRILAVARGTRDYLARRFGDCKD